MAILLDLPPDVESSLASEAKRQGVTPEALAADNLKTLYRRSEIAPTRKFHEPAAQPISATAALFASWAAQNATDDPEENARRQQEDDELLAALDASPFTLRQVDLTDWPDEASA